VAGRVELAEREPIPERLLRRDACALVVVGGVEEARRRGHDSTIALGHDSFHPSIEAIDRVDR
jgi:hypothetical protein